MLRQTVAIAGLIVIVAASLLALGSQRPGTRAAGSANALPVAGLSPVQSDAFLSPVPGEDAYLPFVSKAEPTAPPRPNCSPCYPYLCIPPPPPDLDCGKIAFCRFRGVGCDPHGFDGDGDGIGCERCN